MQDTLLTRLMPRAEARVSALALSEDDAAAQLTNTLRQADITTLILRPPAPWEPLAPLRHLLEHWGQSLPEFEASELTHTSLWLGPQVASSRLFLRATELLHPCPTIAWIDHEDLSSPVWGNFLRMVRQGGVKAPLHFLYRREPSQPLFAGVQLLQLQQNHAPTELPPSIQKEFASAPSTYAKRYLGQLLVFGDQLDEQIMAKLSRARHHLRVPELRKAGVLDRQGKIIPGRLRAHGWELPPTSRRWRKQALHHLPQDNPLAAQTSLWLSFSTSPALPPKSEQGQLAALLNADLETLVPQLLSPPHHTSEDLRLAAYLIAARIPEIDLPSPGELALPLPLKQLAEACTSEHQATEKLASLNRGLQEVLASGEEKSTTLLAAQMARWHLGCGRVPPAFALLNPTKDVDDWACQWLLQLQFADAFSRLGRIELARHALECAAESAPRPLSPVLIGDLRLATARFSSQAGRQEEAELQLSEARDAFRLAGDGGRLGRYLLLAAEQKWGQGHFEDARGLLGRALDLFRRYRDSVGILEAQLKLRLVLNESPIEVIKPT